MKKITLLSILSSILLFGCAPNEEATEEKKIDDEVEETTPETEEIEEEESWEDAIEDVDFETENIEEIPWDEIDLTKSQFDDFLTEMEGNSFQSEDEGDEEEFEIDIESVDFDGKIIEFTIIDDGGDDLIAEFTRTMYIFTMDAFTRQFYLASDYSDGDTHPTIIFYDEIGEIITENDDFIEFDEEE